VARALAAGAAYFGLVFALGFVLGTVRELMVVPRLGPIAPVLIEVPLMLTASFGAARVVARRLAVPDAAGERLAMGAVAFVLLIAAETLTGLLLMGRSPGEQLAGYGTPRGAIGLAAQIAFALIPLVSGPTKRAGSGEPAA